MTEARRHLAQWLARWQSVHRQLCDWVEANLEETLTFYRLPRAHHNHLRSTNLLERLNQEINRRTLLVRIFPIEHSCLRLVRAPAVEIHGEWVDENRYLDKELLRDHLKATAQATRGGSQGPLPPALPINLLIPQTTQLPIPAFAELGSCCPNHPPRLNGNRGCVSDLAA